jgi:hypothetical protein
MRLALNWNCSECLPGTIFITSPTIIRGQVIIVTEPIAI